MNTSVFAAFTPFTWWFARMLDYHPVSRKEMCWLFLKNGLILNPSLEMVETFKIPLIATENNYLEKKMSSQTHLNCPSLLPPYLQMLKF